MTFEEKSKAISEYKASLKDKTLKQLQDLEQKIIKEADKHDEKLKKAEFTLPTEKYAEVATAIQEFLDKQEIQWQFTLGMKTMYEFWDPKKNPKKVSYAMFDQTLRTIGNIQFKGYEEWCKVVTVNTYFEPLSPKYIELTEGIQMIAEKHSAILDAMKLFDVIEPVNEDNAIEDAEIVTE